MLLMSKYLLLYNEQPSPHSYSVRGVRYVYEREVFDCKEQVDQFFNKHPNMKTGWPTGNISWKLYKLADEPAVKKEIVKREVEEEVFTVL